MVSSSAMTIYSMIFSQKELDHHGIRDVANKWMCSYLMNRSQYVCINDTSSESLKVTCGVPQGSMLGPALLSFIY